MYGRQPLGVLPGRNGSPKYKLEGRNQPTSQSVMTGPGTGAKSHKSR